MVRSVKGPMVFIIQCSTGACLLRGWQDLNPHDKFCVIATTFRPRRVKIGFIICPIASATLSLYFATASSFQRTFALFYWLNSHTNRIKFFHNQSSECFFFKFIHLFIEYRVAKPCCSLLNIAPYVFQFSFYHALYFPFNP